MSNFTNWKMGLIIMKGMGKHLLNGNVSTEFSLEGDTYRLEEYVINYQIECLTPPEKYIRFSPEALFIAHRSIESPMTKKIASYLKKATNPCAYLTLLQSQMKDGNPDRTS